MKYYQILMDDGYKRKNDVICYVEEDYEIKYGVNHYDVNVGKFIEEWKERITFYYDSDEGNVFSDYLGEDLGWFILSPTTQCLFKELGLTNIQYLPVIIKNNKDNREDTGYAVANITKVIDGIHHEYCEYEMEEVDGEPLFVMLGRYVLNKEKVSGLDIFKLQGDFHSIFVSERVKKAIQKRRLTGFSFLDVETRE